MRKIFLYIIFGIGLISCSTSKKTLPEKVVVEKPAAPSLAGTWQLQTLFASDNKWASAPFININLNDKTFSGNTSCNTIRGTFTINESYLGFDRNIASTKMACPDNYQYEKSFLSTLLKVNKYTIDNDELELGQGEIVLMKFKRN